MQWSFDGKLLVSGGNDNVLNIWIQRGVLDDVVILFCILMYYQVVVKVMCQYDRNI